MRSSADAGPAHDEGLYMLPDMNANLNPYWLLFKT